MKRTPLFIVVLELVAIFALVGFIYIKLTAKSSVNPIDKDSIAFDKSGKLKYYYEPAISTTKGDLENPKIEAKYTINKDSLNERYDYPLVKEKNTYRIVTLGDSYTYGLYVDTPDNWPEVLEDRLNKDLKCNRIGKFEVINLGVHGYDTKYTVERFIKRGLKYNPDIVIWLFVDMFRVNELQIPLANQYEKTLEKGEDYYLPWRTAKKDVSNKLGVDGVLKYQENALNDFKKYYSGPLLAVPSWRIGKNSKEENLIIDFAKKRNSTYYMQSIQSLKSESLLFEGDLHPNEAGHRFIADGVFEYISRNNLVGCVGGN